MVARSLKSSRQTTTSASSTATWSWQVRGFIKCLVGVLIAYISIAIGQYTNNTTWTQRVEERGAAALQHPGRLAERVDFTRSVDEHSRDFRNSNFLYIEDFLGPEALQAMIDEVRPLRHLVYRNGGLALAKKGGGLSYFQLMEHCPQIFQFYHSSELLQWVHRMTGYDYLQRSPLFDPHSVAIYWYDQKDDHIRWHWDTSFFDGVRYTLLLPLLDDTSMRLEAQVLEPAETLENVRHSGNSIGRNVSVATKPGSSVLFLGDSIRHRVTPMLHHNETRVIVTMEFVSSTYIAPHQYWIYANANAGGYFGFPLDLKLMWMMVVMAVLTLLAYIIFLLHWAITTVSGVHWCRHWSRQLQSV